MWQLKDQKQYLTENTWVGYTSGGIFIDYLWRPTTVFPGKMVAEEGKISMKRILMGDSWPGELGHITQN